MSRADLSFTPVNDIIMPYHHEDMEVRYKEAEGASKLKRIRENRGLSQTELAEQ